MIMVRTMMRNLSGGRRRWSEDGVIGGVVVREEIGE